MRLTADLGNLSPEQIVPGTVYVVAAVDGRNRLVYLQPGTELGLDGHVAGFSTVRADQSMHFVPDSQARNRNGQLILRDGVPHMIVQHHGQPPRQRRTR